MRLNLQTMVPIAKKNSQQKSCLQLVFLAMFLGAVLFFLNTLGVFARPGPDSHMVTYRVKGSAAMAVITYTQANGESNRPVDVRVPWEKSIRFSQPGLVILTVGNPNQAGNIECILELDGEEWKREIARPPDDKASCAGLVP